MNGVQLLELIEGTRDSNGELLMLLLLVGRAARRLQFAFQYCGYPGRLPRPSSLREDGFEYFVKDSGIDAEAPSVQGAHRSDQRS